MNEERTIYSFGLATDRPNSAAAPTQIRRGRSRSGGRRNGASSPIRPSAEELAGIRLFSGLSADVLIELASASCTRLIRRSGGGELTRCLGAATGFVLKGAVDVNWFAPSGLACPLQTAGPGDWIGLSNAFAKGEPPAGLRLRASENSWLALTPHAALIAARDRHPPLAAAISAELASATRQLERRLFELATQSLRTRLAAELLRLAKAKGPGDAVGIEIAASLPMLSARVTATREAISRHIRAFEGEHLLTQREGRLFVHDVAGLAALAPADR